MKPTQRTTFEIDGFTLAARWDRATFGEGGVAILVRNYMDATEIDLDTDDICAITTTIDRKKTCIISCYWGFTHRGIPNLDTLKDLLSHHKHSVVLGDFNAYHPTWGHQEANERGRAIRRLCKEFDLHLQNNHNQPETGHPERDQAIPDYEPLRHAYWNITKEIKTQLHEEKKAAQMREVEALNPRDSQKKWRTINNLTGQTKPEKKPIKLINPATNTKTKSEMETANTFATQLAKVHRTHSDIYFNHEHKAEVNMWAESMKEHLTPRSAPAAPSDEYSRTITSEDTYRALKSLKNKTSPGEDTFPKKWKHAIGKMIQKPNKPKVTSSE